MDLKQHIGVWWRWKAIIAVGLVLAVVLGVLASFKISLSNGFDVKWRSVATYTSASRLFVTQRGFPWGRATLPGSLPGSTTQPAQKGDVFASPDRFSNLAIVYSYMAQSSQVRALISPHPLETQIVVTPQSVPGSNDPLPILQIQTQATSPADAAALNGAAIRALRTFLAKQSDAAAVPSDQRVEIQVLNPPELGQLTAGRSPTLSAVAFVLVLVATFALVYILQNLTAPPGSGARRRYPAEAEYEPVVDAPHAGHPSLIGEVEEPMPISGGAWCEPGLSGRTRAA